MTNQSNLRVLLKMMIKLAETKEREKKMIRIKRKMMNKKIKMKMMIKNSKKSRNIRKEVKISWVTLK